MPLKLFFFKALLGVPILFLKGFCKAFLGVPILFVEAFLGGPIFFPRPDDSKLNAH